MVISIKVCGGTNIYVNAGQHKEAREVVNNEALSPHDRELFKKNVFLEFLTREQLLSR